MAYENQQITIDAWTASVDVEDVPNPSGVPSMLATARITVGGTEVMAQATATLGPVDGLFGEMPVDHVQRSLDAVRQRAARSAAYRANVEQQKQSAS